MVEKIGIDFVMPFVLYDYIEEKRRRVTANFFCLRWIEKNSPRVTSYRMELQVGTTVPTFFQNSARIILANKNKDRTFTSNTHKATAFAEVIRRINNELNYPDNLNGPVQRTKLPFRCEEEILSWEVQAFENDDVALTKSLGQQYFCVISVELISSEKVKSTRASGEFVVFKSPVPTGGKKSPNTTTSTGDYMDSLDSIG